MKKILKALVILCSLFSFGQNKDTLYFAIDKQYTISPTVTANMPNLSYIKYIDKIKKQKKLTQTNGYIYFIGNGILTKGLKPKKIHSIKEYIENRKFYYDGNYNQIIDEWKLRDQLIEKFVIFFVNKEEFIQPRFIEYQSYFPIPEGENLIINNQKDTLVFKIDNQYLYESKNNEGIYIFDDSSPINNGTLFFVKQKKNNIKYKNYKLNILDFKTFVRNSRFYDNTKTRKLNDVELYKYLSNYELFFISTKNNELIKVHPNVEIE